MQPGTWHFGPGFCCCPARFRLRRGVCTLPLQHSPDYQRLPAGQERSLQPQGKASFLCPHATDGQTPLQRETTTRTPWWRPTAPWHSARRVKDPTCANGKQVTVGVSMTAALRARTHPSDLSRGTPNDRMIDQGDLPRAYASKTLED